MAETQTTNNDQTNTTTIVTCKYCGGNKFRTAALCKCCGTDKNGKRIVHLDWQSGVSAGAGLVIVLPIILVMALVFFVIFAMARIG